MYELNKNVIFVKGAKNGAIYDFNTGNLFSVNNKACLIIDRYINRKNNKEDKSYLDRLRTNNLISSNFSSAKYQIDVSKKVRLEMAWIEITQRCNLKCLHCYEGNKHVGGDNTLSTEEWKDKIDQLVELGISRLIIIGGEPGCHKGLIDLILHATKYPIDITLFTNATCLTKQLLKCIIENRIRVKVSVYGHCAGIHDLITGVHGSFEKMTVTVRYLVENGVKVSSAVIIMKENQEYVEEIIKFVKSIGMKYSRYDVIREVFGGTQSSHIPTDKKILNSVLLKKPNFRADKKIFLRNSVSNTCWYGKIAIMENGDVIPCEFERNIKYGNVRSDSIKDIINDERTVSKWFFDFEQIEGCKDCEYRFACNDCRPMGISVCGDIRSKNPRCCYDVYKGLWK